jgi:hypothetical protein
MHHRRRADGELASHPIPCGEPGDRRRAASQHGTHIPLVVLFTLRFSQTAKNCFTTIEEMVYLPDCILYTPAIRAKRQQAKHFSSDKTN